MRTATGVVLAALALTVLAACGGDDDEDTSAVDDTEDVVDEPVDDEEPVDDVADDAVAGGEVDACALTTEADLEELLGPRYDGSGVAVTDPTSLGLGLCGWSVEFLDDGGTYVNIGVESPDDAEFIRRDIDDVDEVPDIGDEAVYFFDELGGGNTLHVTTGDDVLTVASGQLGFALGEDNEVDVLVAIAELALPNV